MYVYYMYTGLDVICRDAWSQATGGQGLLDACEARVCGEALTARHFPVPYQNLSQVGEGGGPFAWNEVRANSVLRC